MPYAYLDITFYLAACSLRAVNFCETLPPFPLKTHCHTHCKTVRRGLLYLPYHHLHTFAHHPTHTKAGIGRQGPASLSLQPCHASHGSSSMACEHAALHYTWQLLPGRLPLGMLPAHCTVCVLSLGGQRRREEVGAVGWGGRSGWGVSFACHASISSSVVTVSVSSCPANSNLPFPCRHLPLCTHTPYTHTRFSIPYLPLDGLSIRSINQYYWILNIGTFWHFGENGGKEWSVGEGEAGNSLSYYSFSSLL